MSTEWNEAMIQAYIDGKIEEDGAVEYKAAGAFARVSQKTDEITKDVSAFANAPGGIIIYGIGQFGDKEREHLPEKITPIDRREFGKEWLEHVIGNIQPRLPINIYPVQLESGPNDVAYVVDIPSGETAHQAADCRYYQRQNFERPMMRDYQIRDVMRRRKHPTIGVEIRIIIGKYGWSNRVWWRVTNTSEVFARDFMLVLTVPISVRHKMIGFDESIARLIIDEGGGGMWQLRASNALKRPLFPGSDMSGDFPFSFANAITDSKKEPVKISSSKTTFRVFADEMPSFNGTLETEPLVSVSEFDTSPNS